MIDVLVALLWGVGAAALAWCGFILRRRRRTVARLEALGITEAVVETRVRRSALMRVEELGERLVARWPRYAARMGTLLMQAGLSRRVSPALLLGLGPIAAALGLLLGIGLTIRQPAAFLLIPALTAFGYFLPTLLVARVRSQRQQRVLRDLMTVMDLLALTLRAGLALDRALRTIVEQVDSPLTDELALVLRDLELGLPRADAFRRLNERVPLDEVRFLSSAIIQAEELGTPLATSTAVQAGELRLQWRRSVEASGLRAPVRMMIPMVLFILPALFIVILAPAGLTLMRSLP